MGGYIMYRILFAFFAMGLLACPVLAKDEKPSSDRGKMFEKELNLSPDQIEKVKVIREKYKADIEGKMKQVFSSNKELKEGMKIPKKGSEYQAELTEKFKKLQSAQQEAQSVKFRMALEIRELMTDQQIAKFSMMREKMSVVEGGKK
jgi:periplasmic protein CpxP/Spy